MREILQLKRGQDRRNVNIIPRIPRKKKGIPNGRSEGTQTQMTVLHRNMNPSKTLGGKKRPRGEVMTLVNRNLKHNGERRGERRSSSSHPHLTSGMRNRNGRRENLGCQIHQTPLKMKTTAENTGHQDI